MWKNVPGELAQNLEVVEKASSDFHGLDLVSGQNAHRHDASLQLAFCLLPQVHCLDRWGLIGMREYIVECNLNPHQALLLWVGLFPRLLPKEFLSGHSIEIVNVEGTLDNCNCMVDDRKDVRKMGHTSSGSQDSNCGNEALNDKNVNNHGKSFFDWIAKVGRDSHKDARMILGVEDDVEIHDTFAVHRCDERDILDKNAKRQLRCALLLRLFGGDVKVLQIHAICLYFRQDWTFHVAVECGGVLRVGNLSMW